MDVSGNNQLRAYNPEGLNEEFAALLKCTVLYF